MLLCTVVFGAVASNISSAAAGGGESATKSVPPTSPAQSQTVAAPTEEEDELYGICGNPDLIDCDLWTKTVENLDDFFARDARGEVPSTAGRVPANPSDAPAGTDVLVNNNGGATGTTGFTQSETDLVAFGNTVVVGFNDSGSNTGGANKFTGFSRSTDGGATFTDGGTFPTSAVGDAGDPVLARDNTTGRIYLSTLGFTSPGTIQMWRSDDNGATWLTPVNATPGGTTEDKQWHTVDNFAGAGNGNVYMLSRRFAGTQGIYFFRSTDNGATFGPSGGTLIVSGSQGAFITVSPDHSIHAFWFAGTSLQVRKSVDQGATFGAPVTVVSGLAGGSNGDLALTGTPQGAASGSFRSNGFPHVAVNPVSGHLYTIFSDNPAGADKADIFMVTSTDGGATWSARVRVNDDATTTDQWQPTVAVSTDGSRLGVFYYSRQEDTVNNNLFRYYGRIGTISGGTVAFQTSFAISDVASLPEFGRNSGVVSTYMGDYDHAVATPGFFHVIWADNRNDLAGGAGRKDPSVYYDKIPLGLVVGSTVPAVGSTVPTVPTTYVINFSEPVNAASVQASDLTVNGVPATSVVNNTSTQSTFTFAVAPPAPPEAENPTALVNTMAIAADAVTRLSDGGGNLAFSGNFLLPTATLNGGTVTLVSESCVPANGVVDPGETVTMSFPVTNVGTGNTTNDVGTLQATGGVTAPGAAQNYGVVVAGGAAVSRNFTFTASPSLLCGDNITATVQHQDGAINVGNVVYTIPTGATGAPVATSYTGAAVAVPDGVTAGVDIILPVATAGNIGDLDFRFDTTGTCDTTINDAD